MTCHATSTGGPRDCASSRFCFRMRNASYVTAASSVACCMHQARDEGPRASRGSPYVLGTRTGVGGAFRTNRQRSARWVRPWRLWSVCFLLGFPVFSLAPTCPHGLARCRAANSVSRRAVQ